jgi:hypothetical protein
MWTRTAVAGLLVGVWLALEASCLPGQAVTPHPRASGGTIVTAAQGEEVGRDPAGGLLLLKVGL